MNDKAKITREAFDESCSYLMNNFQQSAKIFINQVNLLMDNETMSEMFRIDLVGSILNGWERLTSALEGKTEAVRHLNRIVVYLRQEKQDIMEKATSSENQIQDRKNTYGIRYGTGPDETWELK